MYVFVSKQVKKLTAVESHAFILETQDKLRCYTSQLKYVFRWRRT